MIHTRFANRIKAGKPVFGCSTQSPDPSLLEMVGNDWDFAWIDMQHGVMHVTDLVNLIRTCDVMGLTSFVRLPADVPDLAAYALDLDAGGVIVAQVERLDQAKTLVNACRFPPVGNRSFGGRRIIDRFGRDYMGKANTDQLLILQIESPEAAAISDSLAALPGVDGLMIGPDDMKMRLGVPMNASFFHPELAKASASITTATRKHGKIAMGFADATPEGIRTAVGAGFNMLSMLSFGRAIIANSLEVVKVRKAYEG